MLDFNALMLLDHRTRYETHVVNLPPLYADLVRGVVNRFGMKQLLEVKATYNEPGIMVIHSCLMAERLSVRLRDDTTGLCPFLVTAALLHGISWLALDLWPHMSQPANKWTVSRVLLLAYLEATQLTPEAQDLGRQIAICYGDIGCGLRPRTKEGRTLMQSEFPNAVALGRRI